MLYSLVLVLALGIEFLRLLYQSVQTPQFQIVWEFLESKCRLAFKWLVSHTW